MRAEAKTSLDAIRACMTGEDGGVGYVKLLALIESLDKQSSEGDKQADEVIQIMHRFARLIDIANRRRL